MRRRIMLAALSPDDNSAVHSGQGEKACSQNPGQCEATK